MGSEDAALFHGRYLPTPSEGRDVAQDATPGRPCFSVSASTMHATLSIAIADAPPDAHLMLSARAYGAPARVTLHPVYEGAIALEAGPPLLPKLN